MPYMFLTNTADPRTSTQVFPPNLTSRDRSQPPVSAVEEKYPFHLHDRKKVFTAMVKEFIDSRSGVLEVTQIGNEILVEPGNFFLLLYCLLIVKFL